MAVAASTRQCSNLDVQSVGEVDIGLLIAAVADGDVELVAQMLECATVTCISVGANEFERTPCPTPLHQACFDGRLDLVQLMLNTHGSKTAGDFDPVNCQGQTPLMLAVQSGNVDLVSFLIDIGCAADTSDADANNAMHMVAAASVRRRCQGYGAWSSNEQREMVDLLSSKGVSMRQRNRYGFTPLRLAALMGNYECVHSMLKWTVVGTAKSQPETDVIVRRGPLDELHKVAAKSSDTNDHRRQFTESLDALSPKTTSTRTNDISRNPRLSSNVDEPSSLLGVTPLYAACVTGDIETARLLLDVRLADPDREGVLVVQSLRRTARHLVSLPLGIAVLRNDVQLARLLLGRGASACRRCLDGPPEVIRGTTHRRDEEVDLLELALYTDWPISRLLVASGACVTPSVERFVEAALRSADREPNSVEPPSMTSLAVTQLALAIYEATGNRESACRMLGSTASGRSMVVERLASVVSRSGGESLLQLTRLVIRKSLGARVLNGVGRLPVPSVMKRFIALDEIPLEATEKTTFN